MELKSLICIDLPNLSLDKFKAIYNLAIDNFHQFKFEYKEPYDWWESVPNPYYNQNIYSRNNETTNLEYRNSDCAFEMHLKKINHINFNIKCFLYQGKIYIFRGVYYYAHFNASNLELFIRNYFLGISSNNDCKTYYQWIKEHPDQKFAQHNYKIDREDLAKIGIKV